MKQICEFKKGADIMETQPCLAVDINDQLESGNIVDTCVPANYNEQKAIEEIGSRVRDQFDVIEFERSYTKLRKYINDNEKEDK